MILGRKKIETRLFEEKCLLIEKSKRNEMFILLTNNALGGFSETTGRRNFLVD